MEALELVLFLLVAVVASSILEKLLPRLSLPLVQIALGAVIACVVATPFASGIDPELLLILFIAPLHFNESRHADSGMLWKNRWGIASLAVGLVVAITVAVGCTLHALLPVIPLAGALALGAAMGSTDAVAVTNLSKDFRFGRHHETLLTGEAFFNDVTGTVIFQCAIAVVVSGTFSLAHAGEEFALDLFGGMLGGAVMGFLAWALLEGIRRAGIDGPTLHVTLELLIPFIIYLIAEQLHIGGVIAVVLAGMVMSIMPQKHTAALARQKLQSRSVWNTVEFILNGIIFVILGMQLPRLLQPVADGGLGDPALIIGTVLAVTLVLEGVRFLWILGMDAVHERAERRRKSAEGEVDRTARLSRKESLKGTLAMTFAGPKGGITLSLMLTVPAMLAGGEAFAPRAMLISVASGVILCTLLLANFAVPLLVPRKQAARTNRARVDAEMHLVERVIDSIQADAHLTGAVQSSDACEEADEPATVIVMKEYADRLAELIPHATPQAAAQAKETVARCEALYERVDVLAREVEAMRADEEDGESSDDSRLTAHFRALRAVYDATEDVHEQALRRELEFIKQMRAEGDLPLAQAKQLRNEVYIQQMSL